MVPIVPTSKTIKASIREGRLGVPGPEGDRRIKVPAFHIHPLGAGPLTASSVDVGFRSSRLEDFLAGKWQYLPLEACKSAH